MALIKLKFEGAEMQLHLSMTLGVCVSCLAYLAAQYTCPGVHGRHLRTSE